MEKERKEFSKLIIDTIVEPKMLHWSYLKYYYLYLIL